MRFHYQNLNENGLMIFAGRAWLRVFRELRTEWYAFHKARGFEIGLRFGGGDGDDEIVFHVAIPFLLSIYLSCGGIWRCKEWKTGLAIHSSTFWIYPASWANESNSRDPWYRRCISITFPWQYDWYSSELLEFKSPSLAKTVWMENRGDRRKRDGFEIMRERSAIEVDHSHSYGYTYRLKSGELQHVMAKVRVDRMTWRMRWYPILPFQKVSTSIWVEFSEEVGEGRGSWKGGCTACGYEIKPGEHPLTTLRRMEHERRFDR